MSAPRKKLLATVVIPDYIETHVIREVLDRQNLAEGSDYLLTGHVLACFHWEAATTAIGYWY